MHEIMMTRVPLTSMQLSRSFWTPVMLLNLKLLF